MQGQCKGTDKMQLDKMQLDKMQLSETANPVEMVSCDSSASEGIPLHLEFWKLDRGRMLIKMGTMFDD